MAKGGKRGLFGGIVHDHPAARNVTLELSLCEAVRSRQIVQFTFNGATRTVAPHVVHTPKDKVLVAGDELASSKRPSGEVLWRSYEIGLITLFQVTGNLFEPNRKFNSRTDDYRNVRCAVDRP